MLDLYKKRDTNLQLSDASIVLLSAGFLKDFNTITNNKLFDLLNTHYNVFGIDNAGHGIEKPREINVLGQRQVILENIENINKNIHIISNSLFALLTLHSIYGIIKDQSDKFNIKTLTLLSPVINLRSALEYGYNRKNVAEEIRNKKNNTDIDKSLVIDNNIPFIEGLLSSKLEDYYYNIETIIELNKILPIHIIGNINDCMLNNSSGELINILKENKISYTFENSYKHFINIDNDFKYTNVVNNFDEKTIGSVIKNFINVNDK